MSENNTADKAADAVKDNASAAADKLKEPGMFDSSGSVGSQFTKDGAIGGTAQKVGGPFDEQGAIGKQFTADGSIGSTAKSLLGNKKE